MNPNLHAVETDSGWWPLLWLAPAVVIMALACFASLATLPAHDEPGHVMAAPAVSPTADATSETSAAPDFSTIAIAADGN